MNAKTNENSLIALKQSYIASFPEKKEALENAWTNATEDKGAVGNFKLLVHQLAGSGGSYGFNDLSQAARSLDERLRDFIQLDDNYNINDYAGTYWKSLIDTLYRIIDNTSSTSQIKTLSRNIPNINTNKLIFLVEDDPDQANRVITQLKQDGYQIEYFSDGSDLRTNVIRHSPELIILDIHLHNNPEAGIQLALDLQKLKHSPPILFVSGQTNIATRLKAIRSNAAGYLSKPFSLTNLARHIERLLSLTTLSHKQVLHIGTMDITLNGYQDALLASDIHMHNLEKPTSIENELKEYNPGLIIIDAQFDNDFDTEIETVGGCDLARIIRLGGCYTHVPIIIIGDNLATEEKERAVLCGADDVVDISTPAESFAAQIDTRINRYLLLSHQLEHDSLTGLFNHTAFMERAHTSIARSIRIQQPFCIALIDIEQFHMINKQYGLNAGDNILREIASRLKHIFRSTDIIGRYTEECFILLLPEINSSHANALFDRAIDHLQSTPYTVINEAISINISSSVVSVSNFKAKENLNLMIDSIIQHAINVLEDVKKSNHSSYSISRYP